MTRVSLVDAYDNRDVIVQIENLKKGKQDKLNAGTGVTIDGNTINVDTSDLATKVELTNETARLDTRIDDVDAKIPPLASKAELADETARLDTRIDDVDAKIPPLASKEELNAQAARLDAKIDTTSANLDSKIDASNVKIKTNADAIHTIEGELGSDALPGTIYYRIAKVENDVITLKPLVNDSIKKVDVEGDASTVYHRALHNSGVVENDALPVASDTKAGVMSAGMYVGFNGSIQNLQARMSVLEGVGITYQLTGLPDNATSEQITSAFREQYPNVPLMAGIRAADYDKAKIWQYSGTSWIQLTSINVNTATSTSLGLVKGSVTSDTNDGKIFVEIDGSMTVIGWDTLKALATAAKQSVDNLEPKVTQQSAKIDALEGDVAANAADITALQGTSANHESRISSLETTSADLRTRMGAAETDIDTLQSSDAQQTSKISSLETTSANLGTRMGAAETDIDTLQASDAQQTSKISALESDMSNLKPRVGQLESDVGTLNTKVDQHTQSISGLSTDVNALKTSKQDKLTAGENIQIQGNVISAESYTPVTRVIEGADNIFAEFKLFLENAKIGDEFGVYQYTTTDFTSGSGLDKIIQPRESGIVRFRDSSNRTLFDLEPWTPIRMIREYIVPYISGPDGKLRTFCFEGACEMKGKGDSSYEKKHGQIYFSMVYGSGSTTPSYVNVAAFDFTKQFNSSAKQAKKIGVIIENSITSDKESYFAVVNYE